MHLLEHLHGIVERYQDLLDCRVEEFTLGSHRFAFNRKPSIMGVINLSADSWYQESVALRTADTIGRVDVLNAQGAQIIDVGAESTLPGASLVTLENQWRQLKPVIEASSIKGEAPFGRDIPCSGCSSGLWKQVPRSSTSRASKKPHKSIEHVPNTRQLSSSVTYRRQRSRGR